MMKDYTVELLKAIASRLSSRADCRQVEYDVYIGICPEDCADSTSDNKIYFYPRRTVFPDTHHRRSTDLADIVQHIIRNQFTSELYAGEDEYGRICFKPGTLTCGEYRYILSFDRKRRQWIRVK